MWSSFWQWIRKHLNDALAVGAGFVVLVLVLSYPQWWGDRSLGVVVGVATVFVIIILVGLVIDKLELGGKLDWLLPWTVVIVPTATALILRKSVTPINFRLPIPQLYIPVGASPQSVSLIIVGLLLLILMWVFVRSIRRGESVAIESHWGGLGGGIGGWQLSAPLIYLLGIVVLLAGSFILAWRVFPPPSQQQSTASVTPSPSPLPPSSPSPSGSPSVTPNR